MSDDIKNVVITDIRMRFWSMVWFMVKWAVASIPALIILGAIAILIVTIFFVLTDYPRDF